MNRDNNHTIVTNVTSAAPPDTESGARELGVREVWPHPHFLRRGCGAPPLLMALKAKHHDENFKVRDRDLISLFDCARPGYFGH